MNEKNNISKAGSYEFEGIGLNRGEKFKGKKRFEQYKEKYHIESLADLTLLSELVFREMLQERYKKKIEKIETDYKKARAKGSDKKTDVAPKSLTYALDQNLQQILTLREKLGLFEDKNVDDAFNHIQILKRKFQKWLDENSASRTFPCPHCSKLIMLRIKSDVYEAQKHTFFKDRFLANEALWKLYKEGKLTKKEVADVLGTPIDYITWLEKKIFPEE